VFITHGGINSINESIYYNIPFIVFPQQGDQFAVSHQVSHLGAGICFENSNITKSELREAVKEVCINNFFSQNRQKINESFKRGGGVEYAADEIFKLKEKLTIH
jgi:UDP:flavonoid glycosyltransferase YjiC (YdhE family)